MLGCCPQIPQSVSLLFALLPSLLSTGNSLYQYPDWEYYPGLGLGSRNFHHHEDQNLRHRWHRRNSKEEPCQATPDIYFVLDKSDSMLHAWVHFNKFVVDMVQRLSNQDLRVSLITFSCKGTTILPITGDREEIHKGLKRLKYSIPAGREHVYRGLWNANKQIIKVNSGGVQRPSMIISLLNSPLDDDTYKYSMGEADDARKMGASVYTVGVGHSKKAQVVGLADKPENAFANKKAEHLKDLIFPLASKACPSLKSSDTSIICIRESNPVVLRGYGFDFVMHKEEVICRFYLSDIDGSFRDVKAINLTKTTVTCPGPIVELPGKVIYVLLSLDNGRNFMNNNVFVASKPCGAVLYTVQTTTTTTTRRPTTKTTRTTTTTTTTTPSTTTTTTTTTTLPMATESPATIPLVTEELKPSSDKFIFAPILLALLLTLLLIGCFWQLCCLPPVEELPPPKPQPQPKEKKELSALVSPPAPAPAVNPSPIVIVCCCTCGGLCVSRDTEGNVIVCNCNHLSCHQLPLMWPQSADQGQYTNVDLMKALCAQETCGPRVSLPPSQEYLPLESCPQGHHFPGICSRLPSRSQLLISPSWVPRARLSLPPMK
ncbi:anthrax toxin receptor-like [Phodopus roborovskii]|uniref:Gm30083 protein n=1 Tax=Phodopus roborovskii TaxID=109678 RepID=A0AAV0A2F9_PHORO|nr:anthrax toxin receptor-like [Phodopus roborovskii]CAH7128335.1 Gm30083 [Phodopus roborovskii]